MANYAIFDEQYYLSQYPWLKSAIDAGIIKSGKEHFEKFGQAGGFTAVSRYFDEETYLAQNPDIAPLVRTANNPNAPFASGLDHFIQFGYEEGRTQVSPDYDEAIYLKRYPVLVPFVQNGTFKSGLDHFVQFGAKQDLYANTFFEPEYLLKNPDIAAAVKEGVFKTGGEHYRKFGQFEQTRSATFVGTKEADIVTGFGVGQVEIIGIQVSLNAAGDRVYEKPSQLPSPPVNDTLIGGQGTDTFVLGVGDFADVNGGRFYGGLLNSNYATIKNFNPQADNIDLAGERGYYQFNNTPNGDFRISVGPIRAVAPVAIVEGGANMPFLVNRGRDLLIFNKVSVLDNFWEAGYLASNPDVAEAVKAGTFASGLDQYTKVGQFETNRSATFVGTSGNDVVTAFGKGKTTIIGVDFDGSYSSDGSNEFDTLIGSEGADTFILAYDNNSGSPGSGFSNTTQELYTGPGEARIRGFNSSQGDALQLSGTLSDYQISSAGGDLVISKAGDRIAILEGGAGLNLKQQTFPRTEFGPSPFLLG
ncbi:hypothetical protein IQ269_24350 [Tychonema sp. LEGE 07199]|uniref:hypothetical protein n=1 Tax=unclassified Tychonema TaxID=2642144 RepID=UPI001880880E|nr:hypothetical protein [Tychonema sp. LEGE 07199]MBE9131265.1 hypothetical protein [Tychonema sp. LEGE 07196]